MNIDEEQAYCDYADNVERDRNIRVLRELVNDLRAQVTDLKNRVRILEMK